MLTAGFLLLGALLLSSNRVEAQTHLGGYNWKQIDQAKPALVAAMIPVKEAVATLPAGPSLDEAKAHLYYYMAIHQSLDAGNAVDYSVFTSLNIFDTTTPTGVGTGLDVVVTPAYRQVLFQDAVSVLTN
jgi:hypothetical protein